MTLVTNIVVAVAEKNGLTVDEMLRMISDVVRMRKEKAHDEP
jgi:Flp pilus assembly protein TadB